MQRSARWFREMIQEESQVPAVLWLHCRIVAQGDVRACLAAWSGLDIAMRAEAYIQPANPINGKRRFRKNDIAQLLRE
jgi:hypothetical protein